MDLLDGWKWRQKQNRREMALLAAWITAPHLKRPLDPNKLVKDDEEKEREKTTPEKTASMLKEMITESGVKGRVMGG